MIPKNEFLELRAAVQTKVDNIPKESKIQSEYNRMKSAETQKCEEEIKKIREKEAVHEEVCNTEDAAADARATILKNADPIRKNYLKFVRICGLVLIGISIVSVLMRFNSVVEWADRENAQYYKLFFAWPMIYTLFFEFCIAFFGEDQGTTYMFPTNDKALNEKAAPYLENGQSEIKVPLRPQLLDIVPLPFLFILPGIIAAYLLVILLLPTAFAELLLFIFSWSGIISGLIMLASFFIVGKILQARFRALEKHYASALYEGVDPGSIESAIEKDDILIEKNNQADLALEKEKARLIEKEKQQVEVRLSEQISHNPEMRDYFQREESVLSYLKRTMPNMVLETLLDGNVANNLLELANVCLEDEITTIKEAGLTWQSRVLDAEVSEKEEKQKAMKSRLNLEEINARLDNITFESSLNEKLSLMKLETNIAKAQADGAISSLNRRTSSVSEKRENLEKLLSEAEETK